MFKTFVSSRFGVASGALTAIAIGAVMLTSQATASAATKNVSDETAAKSVIAVSSKTDRSNSVALQDQTLDATKWIYIKNPNDIQKVVFFLDQNDFGQIHHVENNKPFDFMGTKPDGNSGPLDTNELENGKHSIVAVTMSKGQHVEVLQAEFTVDNNVAAGDVGDNQAPVDTAPPATSTPSESVTPASTTIIPLEASLIGNAEVPQPGDLDGDGTFTGTLDLAKNQICYELSVLRLDAVTTAGIHRGVAGQPGDLVAAIQAPKTGSVDTCNTIDPTVAQRIAANPKNYYVEVNTTVFPNGALRGNFFR